MARTFKKIYKNGDKNHCGVGIIDIKVFFAAGPFLIFNLIAHV